MVSFIFTTIVLFMISSIFPLVSFLLPVYGIREIKKGNMKMNILKNGLVALILLLLNYELLLYYIVIYLGTEMFFLFLENKKIGEYEKIHITALIFTILIYGYINMNLAEFNQIMEQTKILYIDKLHLDEKMMSETINYMKKYVLLIIYIALAFMNFMTYMILKYKSYINWKISYYYLIPYVILFLLEKIYKINNIYIINGIVIFKIPFIIYGVKELYKGLKKYMKNKNMLTIVLMLLSIFIPDGIFILGGIRSFKIFEEVFEDESNIEGKC